MTSEMASQYNNSYNNKAAAYWSSTVMKQHVHHLIPQVKVITSSNLCFSGEMFYNHWQN